MMTPNDKIRIGEYIYFTERKVIEKVFFYSFQNSNNVNIILMIWMNAIFNSKEKKNTQKRWHGVYQFIFYYL